MTRIATLFSAAAVIAATASVAMASPSNFRNIENFGTTTEAAATSVMSGRELSQNKMAATDTVTVTVVPAAEVAGPVGSDR